MRSVSSPFGAFIVLIFTVLSIIGYVLNIISLIGMADSDEITVMLVLRIVGIFAAPLGVLLGYFPN